MPATRSRVICSASLRRSRSTRPGWGGNPMSRSNPAATSSPSAGGADFPDSIFCRRAGRSRPPLRGLTMRTVMPRAWTLWFGTRLGCEPSGECAGECEADSHQRRRRRRAADAHRKCQQAVRRLCRGRWCVARHRSGRILRTARPQRLRQDHAVANARGVRDAGRRRHLARWREYRGRAAASAACEHDVPELRVVSPSQRRGQHRVRPKAGGLAEGRDHRARRRDGGAGAAAGAGAAQAGSTLRRSPAARWGAGFVGDVNLFDGQVVPQTGGCVTVATPAAGMLRVAGEVEAGQAISIAVRPEKLTLSHDLSSGEVNAQPGELIDADYLGGLTRYRVKLAGGDVVQVARANAAGIAAAFEAGQQVMISFAPDDAVVLTQ